MTIRAPYGSWPSPITAEQLSAGTPVGGGVFVGEQLWWLEGRPAEGGRLTVMAGHPRLRIAARELVPAPFNVRTRVNEYGGASWAPVDTPDGSRLVFANFADQRVYLLDPAYPEAAPIPLTPPSDTTPDGTGDPALRFAEFLPRAEEPNPYAPTAANPPRYCPVRGPPRPRTPALHRRHPAGRQRGR